MSRSYARERFISAVLALVGRPPRHERLLDAHGAFHAIKPEDFPEHLDNHDSERQLYTRLEGMLTRVQPTENEGPVCATPNTMTLAEMNEAARLICQLSFRLREC